METHDTLQDLQSFEFEIADDEDLRVELGNMLCQSGGAKGARAMAHLRWDGSVSDATDEMVYPTVTAALWGVAYIQRCSTEPSFTVWLLIG